MIQCINCPCGKTFAASSEPYCYEDAEWQKDMRNYLKKGCTVKMAEKQKWSFNKCTCQNMKPVQVDKSQLSIFSDLV